jgi:hypothetical protein
MKAKSSSPINIEHPEERSPIEEETSPQTSIVGSLIENAMHGAQAASNYLFSFISPPEQKPQGTLRSPIGSSTPTSTTQSGGAEHEANVLAGWRKTSPTMRSPPTYFPTHVILSEYMKPVILQGIIPENPILSLKALSTVPPKPNSFSRFIQGFPDDSRFIIGMFVYILQICMDIL